MNSRISDTESTQFKPVTKVHTDATFENTFHTFVNQGSSIGTDLAAKI